MTGDKRTTKPCDECGAFEVIKVGEVRLPGSPHHRTCPKVQLAPRSAEEQAEFERELRAIEDAERRAFVEGQTIWLR